MIAVAVLVTIILMAVYEILGMTITWAIKARQSVAGNLVFGYLTYYILYQILYLICVTLHNELRFMGIIWIAVISCILIVSIFISIRSKSVEALIKECKGMSAKGRRTVCMVIGITLAVVVLYICGIIRVSGESYAYSAVRDALETGKMFLRDVYTGENLSNVDMPYALSGYYMHSALLCSIFKLSPIMVQHNVIGSITIIISVCIVYLIGREFYGSSINKTCALVVFYELVNLYLILYGNEHYFLLGGAYDELVQLSYVLVTGTILGYISIGRYENKKNGWCMIMLCTAASGAMSVSSVTVLPVMVLCGTVSMAVIRHNYRVVIYGMCSMIPCVIYNVMYYICR